MVLSGFFPVVSPVCFYQPNNPVYIIKCMIFFGWMRMILLGPPLSTSSLMRLIAFVERNHTSIVDPWANRETLSPDPLPLDLNRKAKATSPNPNLKVLTSTPNPLTLYPVTSRPEPKFPSKSPNSWIPSPSSPRV